MDSLNNKIKVEKANAIKKHRQLQRIASLFRFVEICVVIAILSRFSVKLPVAVKSSSAYLKDLTVILVSPRFVFIIGNIIIITLFAKSGQFSGKSSTSDIIYEEFLKESENREKQSISVQQVAENREKQSISSLVPNIAENIEKESTSFHKELKKEETSTSLEIKNYECRELRRTVTEKYRGSVDCREGWVKLTYPEDRMTNDEFRCTIDSFIERQKRFRRDEEIYYCIFE